MAFWTVQKPAPVEDRSIQGGAYQPQQSMMGTLGGIMGSLQNPGQMGAMQQFGQGGLLALLLQQMAGQNQQEERVQDDPNTMANEGLGQSIFDLVQAFQQR